MFTRKNQSKEYHKTLDYFKEFCLHHNKHVKYYKERCEEIVKTLPQGIYDVSYNKDNMCFVFINSYNKDKIYISDEQFGFFDLYMDTDFYSLINSLRDMYKPAIFECYYNNGNTHHSDEMTRNIVPLLKRISEYKESFKFKLEVMNVNISTNDNI